VISKSPDWRFPGAGIFIEHVFGVVKGLLKFKKTRYRGLRKQEAKLNIMIALANLILADRSCLAA